MQRIIRGERLAIQLDAPGGGSVRAAEDFHERAFPGSIFADQRVHLPRCDLQMNVLQGAGGAKTLLQSEHSETRCHGGEVAQLENSFFPLFLGLRTISYALTAAWGLLVQLLFTDFSLSLPGELKTSTISSTTGFSIRAKRMIAIEETAAVQANGTLVLHHPELKPGEQVKVIVLLAPDHTPEQKPKASATGRRLKGEWGERPRGPYA